MCGVVPESSLSVTSPSSVLSSRRPVAFSKEAGEMEQITKDTAPDTRQILEWQGVSEVTKGSSLLIRGAGRCSVSRSVTSSSVFDVPDKVTRRCNEKIILGSGKS